MHMLYGTCIIFNNCISHLSLVQHQDNKLYFPQNQDHTAIIRHMNENVCHDTKLIYGRASSNKSGEYRQFSSITLECAWCNPKLGKSRMKKMYPQFDPEIDHFEPCKFKVTIFYDEERKRWFVRQHGAFCWKHTGHPRDEEKLKLRNSANASDLFMEEYRAVCSNVEAVNPAIEEVFKRKFRELREEILSRSWELPAAADSANKKAKHDGSVDRSNVSSVDTNKEIEQDSAAKLPPLLM